MRAIIAPPLYLEPLVAAHAPEMFAVLSDPAIYEFENEPPVSESVLATRYTKWENRQSADGSQLWLNWVIRLPSGKLAGYVQSTVLHDGFALIAYELGSAYWRQGIGSTAVTAALDELRTHYAVCQYVAILKASNYRSLGLLRKLHFEPASSEQLIRFRDEDDEIVMTRMASDSAQS